MDSGLLEGIFGKVRRSLACLLSRHRCCWLSYRCNYQTVEELASRRSSFHSVSEVGWDFSVSMIYWPILAEREAKFWKFWVENGSSLFFSTWDPELTWICLKTGAGEGESKWKFCPFLVSMNSVTKFLGDGF